MGHFLFSFHGQNPVITEAHCTIIRFVFTNDATFRYEKSKKKIPVNPTVENPVEVSEIETRRVS